MYGTVIITNLFLITYTTACLIKDFIKIIHVNNERFFARFRTDDRFDNTTMTKLTKQCTKLFQKLKENPAVLVISITL